MQVSVQNGEGLERRVTVELPAEEIDREAEDRLKRMARTARIDGFRPGKAPMKLLRARYLAQVQQEVFAELVESSFSQVASQEQLQPAGRPSIEPDIEPASSRYAYTAVFEVLPKIELVSLADATIHRLHGEVTQADVDEMIERLRKQRLTWREVERPAQAGDQVTLSFQGTLEGQPFEGGSASQIPLVLGAGSMVEDFESGLAGVTPGETRSLAVKFPEDYRVTHLAGKAADFQVEVHRVTEPVFPELDATLAKSFGVEDGDLERFRKDIRSNMERELKQRIEANVKEQAMDALLAAHVVDLPKVLVEEEIGRLSEQIRQGIGGGNRMALPRQLFENQARRRVGLGLLIAEVVRQQGIKVDQERVNRTIAELASTYEYPEEVIEYYRNNRHQRIAVENLVLEGQVVDWVLDQVRVEDITSSFAEITQDLKSISTAVD